jgi:hypothetical protein
MTPTTMITKKSQKLIPAWLIACYRQFFAPGHRGNPGNDTADNLAKEAVSPKETHKFRHLVSAQKRGIRERILAEWEKEWQFSDKGKHLRRMDDGLPSKRARNIYDLLLLQRHRAYLKPA